MDWVGMIPAAAGHVQGWECQKRKKEENKSGKGGVANRI